MVKKQKILKQAKTTSAKTESKMIFNYKTRPSMVVASLLAVTAIFGADQNCVQETPTQPEKPNSCVQKSNPPDCVQDIPTTHYIKQPGGPECHPPQPLCQPQVCRPGKCGVLQDPPMPQNPAYNAPAEINVGLKGETDYFITLSFIYWQPTLDHFSYAFVDQNQIPASPVPGIRGKYLEMDYDFKPGFQFGVGMNLPIDDWDLYAEYTRVHGHHSASSGDADLSNGSQASILATMGSPYLLNNDHGGVYQYAKAKYTNNLDFIDAEMGRTYYVGQHLIFRSSYGLRTAWILQNMHVNYGYPSYLGIVADQNDTFGTLPSYVTFVDRVHSWGIGPRAGLKMDWVLGKNIRFIGNGFVDVLYTRYHLKDKTTLVPNVVTTDSPNIGQTASVITRDKVSAIRTHLDMEIGLGWGYYFDQKNWHLDLAATYGFQVFFSQNMFRQYFNNVTPVVSTYSGDMNIQGLTLKARLDF